MAKPPVSSMAAFREQHSILIAAPPAMEYDSLERGDGCLLVHFRAVYTAVPDAGLVAPQGVPFPPPPILCAPPRPIHQDEARQVSVAAAAPATQDALHDASGEDRVPSGNAGMDVDADVSSNPLIGLSSVDSRALTQSQHED